VLGLTQVPVGRAVHAAYGTFTLCGRTFQICFATNGLGNSLPLKAVRPYNPDGTSPVGLGASPLPRDRFLRPQDQCFLAHRNDASDQDRPLVTAFRSPATAAPFEATIPGSPFPACYFATSRLHCTARSDLRSTADSGSPRSTGRFIANAPLPRLACGSIRRSRKLDSPSGPLQPSGSNASLLPLPIGPPSESARSPLAPRCLLSLVTPDHRSWLATFP
jgi:hypothetical protein